MGNRFTYVYNSAEGVIPDATDENENP